jgi:hypothetical protein
MTLERIPSFEDVQEIYDCAEYKLSAKHRKVLKRIADHIKEYNPHENTYVVEMLKEDLIKFYKTIRNEHTK